MIDVTHQISSVRRHIGTRTLEAGQARVLTISQSYDSDLEDVWDACTSAERIPRWFLPISGELKVGGRYQLEGQAGGTIERCEPPTSFAATWEYGGQVSWIEVRLAAEPDGGTTVELEHVAHVDDDLWAQFGPGAVGIGWDMMLMGLALHLSSGESVERREAEAWLASEEGKGFTAASSRQWAQASIAAGTDPAQAEAAAAAITAVYTAPPDDGGA